MKIGIVDKSEINLGMKFISTGSCKIIKDSVKEFSQSKNIDCTFIK
jgi:hypothetical protein